MMFSLGLIFNMLRGNTIVNRELSFGTFENYGSYISRTIDYHLSIISLQNMIEPEEILLHLFEKNVEVDRQDLSSPFNGVIPPSDRSTSRQ